MDKTFDVLYKTRLFKTSSEETLYETLRRHGVYVQSACGGTGRCGKCRIRVQGTLSEPDDTEKSILGEGELERGIRLACRAKARGDLRILEIDSLESDAFALSEPFSASERQRIEGCESRIQLLERTWPEETEAASDMEWLFQDLGQEAPRSSLFIEDLSPVLAASL
ncbi:MAG TPA: 2Fe-2S iron-sulfur cluster-binding protein, partial [Thermotogota bacterium]|nr:2Fe-2S iron-sulfur cluster-binding protein [Thermotogota bacterium]